MRGERAETPLCLLDLLLPGTRIVHSPRQQITERFARFRLAFDIFSPRIV